MPPAMKSGALCSAIHVLQIEVYIQFLKYAVGSNSSRAAIEPWFAKARNKLLVQLNNLEAVRKSRHHNAGANDTHQPCMTKVIREDPWGSR